MDLGSLYVLSSKLCGARGGDPVCQARSGVVGKNIVGPLIAKERSMQGIRVLLRAAKNYVWDVKAAQRIAVVIFQL